MGAHQQQSWPHPPWPGAAAAWKPWEPGAPRPAL